MMYRSSVPVTLLILGFFLVAAGLVMIFTNRATDAAEASARMVTFKAPVQLMLVAMGSAMIFGGYWLFREEQEPAPTEEIIEDFEPWFYGDDSTLDFYWDECESGFMESCDALYFESPVGSDYEWFGWSCGGRLEEQPDDGTCVGVEP